MSKNAHADGYVKCALCGVWDDSANMEMVFQEGTTYPDYWQCMDECDRDRDEDGEDDVEEVL